MYVGQASKRRKVGTAVPCWSVCWHAELVVRGGGCHRARAGDRDTRAANVRRCPESEKWDADRMLGLRAAPWSPDGSENTFDIRVGMERRWCLGSPGEVLMENKVARTYLRRAGFERWASVEVVLGAGT